MWFEKVLSLVFFHFYFTIKNPSYQSTLCCEVQRMATSQTPGHLRAEKNINTF